MSEANVQSAAAIAPGNGRVLYVPILLRPFWRVAIPPRR